MFYLIVYSIGDSNVTDFVHDFGQYDLPESRSIGCCLFFWLGWCVTATDNLGEWIIHLPASLMQSKDEIS